MVKDGALEDNTVLQALRDEPGEINGCVDADRGEAGNGVVFGRRRGFAFELKALVSVTNTLDDPGLCLRLTSGTTSLNQGVDESNSENHSAVADCLSFTLFRISHSAEGKPTHRFSEIGIGDSPWKCTPASGWFAASSSRGPQVFLSHSAGFVPRTDTLLPR